MLARWMFREQIDPEDRLLSRRRAASHLARYRFASPFTTGKRILDLGCGAGYGTAYLKSHGAKEVVGVDIDRRATLGAYRHFGHIEGVFFVQGDARQLLFQSSFFDGIVCMETIEHLPEPEELLAECRRVLTPHGVLILSTPNKEIASPGQERPSWPYHEREFSASELKSLAEGFFGEVELYGQGLAPRDARRAITIDRLALWIKVVLSRVPSSHLFVHFITKLTFKEYAPVDLRRVELHDQVLEGVPAPLPISDVDTRYLLPTQLIAVCRRHGFSASWP